jgi:hypothetical protein
MIVAASGDAESSDDGQSIETPANEIALFGEDAFWPPGSDPNDESLEPVKLFDRDIRRSRLCELEERRDRESSRNPESSEDPDCDEYRRSDDVEAEASFTSDLTAESGADFD